MQYSWLKLNKKYIIKHEGTRKRPTIGGIKKLIEKDEDYFLCIPCPRGEIYRFDEEGRVWGVYVNSPGSKKRYSLWNKLDKLGCKRCQVGDIEATWTFSADLLHDVADILKVHKRYTRKKKNK